MPASLLMHQQGKPRSPFGAGAFWVRALGPPLGEPGLTTKLQLEPEEQPINDYRREAVDAGPGARRLFRKEAQRPNHLS